MSMNLDRVLTVVACSAVSCAASAGTFVDTAASGNFFTSASSNMSIYGNGGDGIFEVTFADYDGDGATPEDFKASGSFDYYVGNPNLGLPAGETFTKLVINARFWEGRINFDGQTPADAFTYQLSNDGINYGSVQLFTFSEVSGSSIFPTVGTSGDFTADYVRINILARVEAAGSSFNDPWSSQIKRVELTTGVIPEPGTLGLASLAMAWGLRRRRA